MKRCPPKSRVQAEKVRVIVHPPRAEQQQGYAEAPGYSGHNGGSFGDARYSAGRGLFGFRQDVH